MRGLVPVSAALFLAACGSDAPEPAPTPTPTQVVTGPRSLVAAGFAELNLGPKIEGPQGPEVSDVVGGESGDLFEIVSYVACPGQKTESEEGESATSPAIADSACDPANNPEGTVYTYVHRVTPGEGSQGPVSAFRMTAPATGFSNTVGYDRAEAEAALGEGYSINIEIENRRLIWRIEKSDGWEAGETITFFWQSTVPPEGPGEGYCLDSADDCADATGPLPPRQEPTAEPTAPAA